MVMMGTPSGTRIKTCVLDGVLEIGLLETYRMFSSIQGWAFVSRGGRSQGSPLRNRFCRGESCIRPSLDSIITSQSIRRLA
jgi:hypothetical protein